MSDLTNLISGFEIVPRIKKIPEIPQGPDQERDLDMEVFERFPECGWYARMGMTVPDIGEIDIMILWGEKPGTARVAAFLPEALPFDIEIIRRDIPVAGSLTPLDRACRIRSKNIKASTSLLESPALKDTILAFMMSRTSAGISASHVTAEAVGVPNMQDRAVMEVVANCAAVVVALFKRMQEMGGLGHA
jgi:hypothetical protein